MLFWWTRWHLEGPLGVQVQRVSAAELEAADWPQRASSSVLARVQLGSALALALVLALALAGPLRPRWR